MKWLPGQMRESDMFMHFYMHVHLTSRQQTSADYAAAFLIEAKIK